MIIINKVILIGRLTKDPELRKGTNDVSWTSGSIAVTRKFSNQSGEYESDFINFIAFGATAELICKYVRKGHRVGFEGRIQTRSYNDQEGKKVYVTEVVVDNIEFLQDKKEEPEKPKMEDPFAGLDMKAEKPKVEDPFAGLKPNKGINEDDLPF